MKANIFFIILLLTGCYENNNQNYICNIPDKKINIIIENKTLYSSIACSTKEKSHGLMYQNKLNQNNAMIFVFEQEDYHGFWMKNTAIPLSIAFINSKGYIVDIKKMKPYDEIPILPSIPAQYAIEVNENWFETNGIKVGNKILLKVP